jgi:cell wall assembly regulator SMI1
MGLVDELRRVHAAILALDGEVTSFKLLPPATAAEIDKVERDMGRHLPPALRRVFVTESAGFDVMWTIDSSDRLPEEMQGCFAGSFDLALADLPLIIENWSGWRDSFAFPEQHGQPAAWNLTIYEALFPLIAAANGDQIVLARDDDEPGEVIYLNHEGDEFDKAILANSLDEFLNVWVPLGCPGPEYWELQTFFDFDAQRLSLDTETSRQWRNLLQSVNA